jgi:hypothetical protein
LVGRFPATAYKKIEPLDLLHHLSHSEQTERPFVFIASAGPKVGFIFIFSCHVATIVISRRYDTGFGKGFSRGSIRALPFANLLSTDCFHNGQRAGGCLRSGNLHGLTPVPHRLSHNVSICSPNSFTSLLPLCLSVAFRDDNFYNRITQFDRFSAGLVAGKGIERENGANPLQGRCCVRRQAVSQKTCLSSI